MSIIGKPRATMGGVSSKNEEGQGHERTQVIGFDKNPLLESLMKLSKISSPFEGIIPDVGGNDTR